MLIVEVAESPIYYLKVNIWKAMLFKSGFWTQVHLVIW